VRSFTLFIIIAFAAFMTAGCEDDIEVTFEMPDGEVYDSVSVDEDGQLEGYPMPELEDEYSSAGLRMKNGPIASIST